MYHIKNIESPVFIIGGSRTGSELLKNVVRKYSDIDFLPEMFLLSPRWLHKDFTVSAKNIENIRGEYNVDQVIDLIYSKELYGYFWTVIDELDKEELKKLMLVNGSDLRGVFLSLMILHASTVGKSFIGAKFPVHYSYIDTLLRWFPEAKLIHTVRDPRAIMVSQTKKYSTSKGFYLKQKLLYAMHFTHILIQTVWTSKVHERWSKHSQYYLFKYEEYLYSPDVAMKSLCAFLGIQYKKEMSEPEIYSNSSYLDKRGQGKGLDINSANSWERKISKMSRFLTESICRKSIKLFGYRI